jgi:hypothetical protein
MMIGSTQLGPEPSARTPEWFERMNMLLPTANSTANSSPFERRMAQWASTSCLFEFGWLDNNHPLRQGIESLYNKDRMTTLRPSVAIYAARTYASFGLDLRQILKSPNLKRITYYPDTIHHKVDGLAGAGLNAIAMIARYPAILDRNLEGLLTKASYIRHSPTGQNRQLAFSDDTRIKTQDRHKPLAYCFEPILEAK